MKCGMVTLNDGKSRPQPVKLELSLDNLTILKEELVPIHSPEDEHANPLFNQVFRFRDLPSNLKALKCAP